MRNRCLLGFCCLAAPGFLLDTRVHAQCDGDWSLRTPSQSPSARFYHAMVYDSTRSVVVLFGGLGIEGDDAAANDETWTWNGTAWSMQTTAPSPSPRGQFAMAFDSNRGVTVLFGGPNSNETWHWDGTNWTLKTPAASPSVRYGHAMAYDSARAVTVLFGGDVVGLSDETWEWDGATWTQRMVQGPAARLDHAMVFDTARGVVVLFGGKVAGGISGETWEWDGVAWSLKEFGGEPSARAGHAMAYDSARELTMLFGGHSEGGSVVGADTWAWDGTTWTKQSSASMPSARAGAAMVYDTNRASTVLFGGAADLLSFVSYDQAWEWTAPASDPEGCIPSPGCGTCGAGLAVMMPLMLLAMIRLAGFADGRNQRLHPSQGCKGD